MTNIAIVYHSGYGHTQVIAEAIARGIDGVDGATAQLITADDAAADLDQLDGADAIVFGTPTYMGGPSASFKAFADASSKKWMEGAWRDKLAAGFTNSGSLSGDKQVTLIYLLTFAMQHKMVWAGQVEPGPGTPGTHGGQPNDINRIGSFTGLMTQADNAPADQSPPEGDRRTAELFGQRIAHAAIRWSHGA